MSSFYDPSPSSSLISSDNVIITGGQFSQIDNRRYYFQGSRSSKAPFDALKEATAPTAFHNSGVRFDSPKCHPRTRVAVLERIMDWITGQDDETRSSVIMWLAGAAGAGKSSIAQSIIEQLLARPNTLMLASFFFNRSDPTRNNSDALIGTLAYQVYRALPAIQTQIAAAIDDDPLIFTKKLDHQLIVLILQPLRDLLIAGKFGQSHSRYLIVIDGLDECINRASQRLILTAIANGIHQFQLPVIFLFASRPEHDISDIFASKLLSGIHTRLILDDNYCPDDDIRTFLSDNFQRIREEHPFRRMIPNGWPEYNIISETVAKSSGQFIYAATVLKFIESTRHRPDHRLDIIRNLRPAKGDLPFEELDALYQHILSVLDSESLEKVLRTLSLIFLCKHRRIPTVDEIEEFMWFEEGEIFLIFCDLGALVDISEDSGGYFQIKILHASLEDFLLDQARSKIFYIDTESARTRYVVMNCLRHMSSVHDSRADISYIVHLFTAFSPECNITLDLADQVAGFPLYETCSSPSFVNGSTKSSLCQNLIPGFFDLIRRIMKEDPNRAQIHDRHLQALDAFFRDKMVDYYSKGSLSLLVALIFQVGSHLFVPLLGTLPGGSLPCPPDILDGNEAFLHDHDILSLFEIFQHPYNEYVEKFRKFMLDRTRSHSFSLGGGTYARAAVYCLQALDENKTRLAEPSSSQRQSNPG